MTNGTVSHTKLVTSIEEIKARRKGKAYTLPGSGISVPLKRPNLLAMAVGVGKIPNPLDDQVLSFLSRNRDADLLDDMPDSTDDVLEKAAKEREREKRQRQRYLENAEVFMKLFRLCVQVELGDDPNADGWSIYDFADQDFIWTYYSFVEGSAAEADKFLTERLQAAADELGAYTSRSTAYPRGARNSGLSEQEIREATASNTDNS